MKIDFDLLKQDYYITDEDDDSMYDLKKRIFELSEAEQRILLLYVDCGSYSEVARQLNVSAPTVRNYINRIKDKLL